MKDTFTLLFDDNTSIDLFDTDYFQTTEISGLTYYKANLNKRTLATIPGDTVTDVHVEPRELTIYFQPKSNNSFSVENAVRYILDHARKGFCIYFLWDKKQSDGTVLNLKARAKIEYIDLPRFENPVDGEIGLHMEYPFFVSETGKSYTLNEYNEFERVITNDGDAAIGVSIDVKFAGDINDLVLENVTTGEKIKLEDYLKEVEVKVDNYEQKCKSYTHNKIYLEIKASKDNKTITYKIDLDLNNNCPVEVK